MANDECQDTHIIMDIHVRSYAACPGAAAFMKWFIEVFAKNNKAIANSFHFSRNQIEGHAVLEVQAHDPLFTIDALESLWAGYKADNAPAPDDKTDDNGKKVVPLKPTYN